MLAVLARKLIIPTFEYSTSFHQFVYLVFRIIQLTPQFSSLSLTIFRAL